MAYRNNKVLRNRSGYVLSGSDKKSCEDLVYRFTPLIQKAREDMESIRKREFPNLSIKEFEFEMLRRMRSRLLSEPERARIKSDLFMSNMPLVFSMATISTVNYHNFRISFEDFFGVCCSAFNDALRLYDFRRGKAKLGNYAMFWMRDAVKRLVCQMAPNASITNMYFKESSKRSTGKEYRMDVLERVEGIMNGAETVQQVFGICDEESESIFDRLKCDVNVEDVLQVEDTNACVRKMLSILNEKEYALIVHTFGVLGYDLISSPVLRKRLKLTSKEYNEYLESALNKLKVGFGLEALKGA